MAQETYYIEQYRHITDSPEKYFFAEYYSEKSLKKGLAFSEETSHITVAVWTIKLKPNATT